MGTLTKVIGTIFLACVLFAVWLMWSHSAQLHESSGYLHAVDTIQSNERVNYLLNMVRSQNHTIVRMGALLKDQHMHPVDEEHLINHDNAHHDITLKNKEILKLKSELDDSIKHSSSIVADNSRLLQENALLKQQMARIGSGSHSTNDNGLVTTTPRSSIEDACERRFGLSLLQAWRARRQVWCGDDSEHSEPLPASQSKLVCYPYLQEHRRIARQGGPDTICVAENFVVDFSRVAGGAAGHKLSNYLSYGSGSLQSSCRKTGDFDSGKLHKHMKNFMKSYKDGQPVAEDVEEEGTPTYVLIRDEDCENSFHSTADFMNMFVAANVVGVHPESQQVMLWDTHPDGPYMDLLSKAFAGGRPLLRPSHYAHKKVLFKKLVFHMESPAGLIFPKVANPTQLRCKGTGLFQAYSKHVLHSFGLWDVNPPAVPHATLLLRHRTQAKNVGRILANEKEVVAALADTNMITYKVADTAQMPYAEQLALVRRTNILIGVHGAGLMLILFAANEAVLVEVHPSYRQDRHFRHASRMMGKDYMPLRAVERETCHGSSDNVKVPIDEFRRALDGAVRLARGYDDGISECGSQCPAGILALDKTLNDHYGAVTRSKKGNSISTRFPC